MSVVFFDEPQATEHRLVGGKGRNLGLLAQAGFAVPAGFSITTASYDTFLDETGLRAEIQARLDGNGHDDAAGLESVTAEIRSLLEEADFPAALRSEIGQAHSRLAADYVAVRSSGAAEDLAGASFAGLHDTYLDVTGVEEVCDAVRRCWASLWTARATSYRQTKGFDHFDSPIAVVVQAMVGSEVSGVLFTGNPMNTATDECVINASWGLGEAVVQGIVTPDQFVVQQGITPPLGLEFVRRDRMVIRERTVGKKTVQIIRNPDTGQGTVTADVPAEKVDQPSLTEDQVVELTRLGRRVEAHYNGIPQDIEWALVDGEFYVLQSRPITGVEFSWDADVNASVVAGEEEDWVWSRRWADEAWTGAVTPLMYSWRCYCWNHGQKQAMYTLGLHKELDYSQMRMWKYYKGRVYFNAHLERALYEKTMPPQFRALAVQSLPPDWREEVLEKPFDWLRYIKMYLRLHAVEPTQGYPWTKYVHKFIGENYEAYNGLPAEELVDMPDEELKRYIEHMMFIEHQWYHRPWIGLLFIFRDVQALLALMVSKWYDGENDHMFTDLIMGTDERTITAVENERLWQIAHKIRITPELRALFDAHRDGEFFKRLQDSERGREVAATYAEFLHHHGHRGAADREMAYPRRVEDPGVDYRALRSLLSGPEQPDPELNEIAVNKRRAAAYAEACENIRRKPLGALKLEAFKHTYQYVHKILVARDAEREFVERPTLAIKRAWKEFGRRAVDRGYLDELWDHNFLTRDELFELLDGKANMVLVRAKIESRKRDFERTDTKEVAPPVFIQNNAPVNLETASQLGDGVLRGIPTSRGIVTGRARVVKTLVELERVQQGDILITFSTDPGWTPVFLIIQGIILETGGMLAHGSLLAREYGFPAVQIENAMSLIPDGATITIDGDSGTVIIVEESEAADGVEGDDAAVAGSRPRELVAGD